MKLMENIILMFQQTFSWGLSHVALGLGHLKGAKLSQGYEYTVWKSSVEGKM